MRLTIQYKLFLWMLAACAAAVLCLFLLMQWSIDRGFLRYVNTLEQQRLESVAQELEAAWSAERGWDELRAEPERLLRLLAPAFAGEDSRHMPARDWRNGRMGGHPGMGMRRPMMIRALRNRLILLDDSRTLLFGNPDLIGEVDLRPLEVEGQVIGSLGIRPRERLTEVHQLQFVEQQRFVLGWVAVAVLLLSAGLSFPLARRLVRPVKALASGTRKLAAGKYDTRVPESGSDELGQLARDFNALALALEKNESDRRQWVADISHELRTPLSILRGEIEALQDGIRQPTGQALASLHSEAQRLTRLVEDLYQLSLSDVGALSYRKEEIDLAAVLSQSVESLRPSFDGKRIAVQVRIPEHAFSIYGDRQRLAQLFGNLLDNAFKYTDPKGRLEIELEGRSGEAIIHLRDSAPGVPAKELPRLFERLYRVERSRSRATGGAGLGLAIARNIVEAHGGTITARPSPLGGVWIEIRLPLSGGPQ